MWVFFFIFFFILTNNKSIYFFRFWYHKKTSNDIWIQFPSNDMSMCLYSNVSWFKFCCVLAKKNLYARYYCLIPPNVLCIHLGLKNFIGIIYHICSFCMTITFHYCSCAICEVKLYRLHDFFCVTVSVVLSLIVGLYRIICIWSFVDVYR